MGALRVQGPGGRVVVRLRETRVFEDVEARIIRLEEGTDAVPIAETDLALGGLIALDGVAGQKIAATPFFGQKNRWDATVDVAFVDRPHLRMDLVFARRDGDRLVEFARQPGLTNHRIGDSRISSGVRDCGHGPVAVLTDAGWQNLLVVMPTGQRDLGPYSPRG